MKESFKLKHYNEFMDATVHQTIKYTSRDESKNPVEYMSQVKTRVIDFDEVKKNYLKNHGMEETRAKSVDALYINDKKICMVEFKNGDFTSSEIIEKALSSAMIFMDITEYNLSEFRKDAVFVLVYNPNEKNPNTRQIAARYKARSSKKNYSLFQLDNLNGFCFCDVVEIEKDEFDSSQYAFIENAY